MTDDNGKLLFNKSNNFFQSTATDCAVSGPTPDGLIHLSFIVDSVDLVSQTKTPFSEDGKEVGFSLSYSDGDTEVGRCINGQCALTENAYVGLFGALVERLMLTHNRQKLIEVLLGKGLKPSDLIQENSDERG